MGLHDRDYYRETPRGIVLNSQLSAVMLMIIINGIVFVGNWLTEGGDYPRGFLNSTLALQNTIFQQPWKLWQLLTYGFLHADIMHLLFNMWGLYVFGSDFEAIYGKRRFLEFYLSTVILSGLIWATWSFFFEGTANALVTPTVIGASGGVVGVVMASILCNPRRTLLFWGAPIPAWVLGMLLIGIDVARMFADISGRQDPSQVAYAAHLGGALMGFIFYTTGWTLATPLPTQFSMKGVKGRINRPKLKIHQPKESAAESSEVIDGDLEAQVDAILAKISEQGQDSLTKKEKKILEAASRQAKERKKQGINN